MSVTRWVRHLSRMVSHTAKKDRRLPILFAGDPYGTRTHVTTVKGWCLNRLTNGPYHLYFIFSPPVPYGNLPKPQKGSPRQGVASLARTHVTTVKGWCLNRLSGEPYSFYCRSITFFLWLVNRFYLLF